MIRSTSGLLLLAITAIAGAASAIPENAGGSQGDGILFVSNRDGRFHIYAMDPKAGWVRQLTQGAGEDTQASVSPDGQSIVFTSTRDGNAEIYAMHADGSAQTRLTRSPLLDMDPQFSPDGKRIAFVSFRDNVAHIYVMNADGSAQRRLTAGTDEEYAPRWSPDGGRIALLAAIGGSNVLKAVDVESGRSAALTASKGSDARRPAWSPDGRKLAYECERDRAVNVYVIDADGRNETNLTRTPGYSGAPQWSPDGRSIAYASMKPGARQEIFVMKADGSDPVNLSNDEQEDYQPAWSTDGRQIYFVSYRDGLAQIYAVDAKGGGAERLTRSAGQDTQPTAMPRSAPSNVAQSSAAGRR